MSGEDQIIRCLLCKCIVTSEKDDARYKDHLKVEHRVYFFMSWIVDITRIENKEESIQKVSELKNILKPSYQLQTTSPMQVVDVNSEDHAVIENKFEEKIDDEKDDDLAWEALSNIMVKINDVGDDSMQIYEENPLENKVNSPDQIAANLVKIEAFLNQNEAEKPNTTGQNDVNADYSNQLNHFLNQSTGMDAARDMLGGESKKAFDMLGEESKKAFLLVYPGEDGKSISYRCSICTSHQSFDSKSKAEQHIKAHIPLHERKRFQCQQCKERFVTAKTLEKHTKLALCQGIKISSCGICKLQFDSKFDLRDHKKTKHKIIVIKNNKKSKEASRTTVFNST